MTHVLYIAWLFIQLIGLSILFALTALFFLAIAATPPVLAGILIWRRHQRGVTCK